MNLRQTNRNSHDKGEIKKSCEISKAFMKRYGSANLFKDQGPQLRTEEVPNVCFLGYCSHSFYLMSDRCLGVISKLKKHKIYSLEIIPRPR